MKVPLYNPKYYKQLKVNPRKNTTPFVSVNLNAAPTLFQCSTTLFQEILKLSRNFALLRSTFMQRFTLFNVCSKSDYNYLSNGKLLLA